MKKYSRFSIIMLLVSMALNLGAQNSLPRIRPPYSMQLLPKQEGCLDIRTEDDDPNDTVTISWNEGLPGATFTNNNGTVRHASGKVCWVPEKKHSSNIPYTFTITATDNAKPEPGVTIKSFQVFVRYDPYAEMYITQLECNRFALFWDDSLHNGKYIDRASWEVRKLSNNQLVYSSALKSDTVELPKGEYRVVLRLTNRFSSLNEYVDTVAVLCNAVGLVEIESNDFKVFPNPAVGFIQIASDLPEMDFSSIKLLDALGKECEVRPITAGFQCLMVDVGHLPSGVYMLRISNHSQPIMRRIVISGK